MNNVEDSAFLVNKLKDSRISSSQKSTNKGNKSSKSNEKEGDEKEDKEDEVNQQNNIKMSKLKKYLEEIASQNKTRKTEGSCRSTELCNYSSSNSKYEYTDFLAFIQCEWSGSDTED